MTDAEISEGASHVFGEPVEAERIVALVEGGEPGETAEIFRITTRTPPRARVTVQVAHELLDEQPWEWIRDEVLPGMRDAIHDLRST